MPESRPSQRDMISVFEARDAILASCRSFETEFVDLGAAVGRVIREDIRADLDIPPFDNSAMDGYAVALSDFTGAEAELEITENVPAGTWPSKRVGNGGCARIMTGAPLPDGTDAVAPVEWTESLDSESTRVRILRKPSPGQHVRKSGSDIRKSHVALHAPLTISARMIGVLASLGYGAVSVSLQPSVSIVATGDELVEPSETPTFGKIRNSNGPTLAALATESNVQLMGQYVARDDREDTRRVFEEALGADVVVISGGVSVGSYDFVKEVLDDMGFKRRFWRVRQRPGKPLTFGTMGDTLVFGLPGNPVSSAVCFLEYVRPALRKMLGLPPGPEYKSARLVEDVSKVPSLHYFIPGRAEVDDEGVLSVRKSGTFGSHIFSSMALANCLISIPEGPETVPAGSVLDIHLIGDI